MKAPVQIRIIYVIPNVCFEILMPGLCSERVILKYMEHFGIEIFTICFVFYSGCIENCQSFIAIWRGRILDQKMYRNFYMHGFVLEIYYFDLLSSYLI